jgi:SAM-dependent methyltransferase
MQGSNHWQEYHKKWSALRPPLRPNSEIIDKVRELVGERDQRVLLLGATPELALAFESVVGVDKNRGMLDNLWPGDTPTRKAVAADWLTLDGSLGRFSAAIGDGSCNAVTFPNDLSRLLEQVRDHLEPGGRFVCRIYERPDPMPPLSRLMAEVAGKARINFHALKWHLAMRVAEETEPTVPVASILARFEELFPDRDRLAERTGWPREIVDTIDTYRGSAVAYCFPNRREFLALMPKGLGKASFHASGTYDLAEWCPMFACERV